MAGQGRRPKSDAIRRAHQQGISPTTPVDSLAMPDVVAESELMRECWEWTVVGASHFRPEDTPQIVELCMWWAISRQCMENLTCANGGIVTSVEDNFGNRRKDPDISTYSTATNHVRQLSAELGISPLARQRMGLMKMQTMTLAADMPSKVFKILDEHRGD
jgi:P27 family predicted phage terminase small subunit